MPRRVGNSAPPKTKPPKPAKTNAFKKTGTGLAPPPGQKLPKTLDPLTAPYKTTATEQAAIAQIRKRQETKEAGIMGRRMQAQSGLPAPGALPFGGGKPGKVDPYQLNLTAKTELAKANVARRQQGGLLTPAQLKREREAENAVVNNLNQTTFSERKDLGTLAGPRPSRAALAAAAPLTPEKKKTPAPKPVKGRAQPAFGARGGRPDFVPPAQHGESLLGRISTGLGTGLELAASIPETALRSGNPADIGYSGGSLGTTVRPAVEDVKPTKLGQALVDTTGRLGEASNAAASAISRVGLETPNVSVPSADLDPASKAALRPGVTSVPAGALGAAGFTVEATEKYKRMALARGWYGQELATLNGLDLLERAYNDPPNMILRTGQNLAAGMARTGAAGTAIVGLAREHNMKALGQLAEAGGSFIGNLAHPKEAFVSDPYGYLPMVGVAGKTAGMAGLLRSAESMGLRDVKTGVKGVTYKAEHLGPEDYGPQAPGFTGTINRGVYSRNLWTQAGERITDRFAERAGQNQLFAGHVDRLVRRAANKHGAQHQVLQLGYRKAQRTVGKKRAEILLAYQQAGHKPELMADLYESLAKTDPKGENSAAAGAARFYREKVIPATKDLTKEDEDFLTSHEMLSGHTSDTLIGLGRFSPTAKWYRAHEGLILAAAHKADKYGHNLEDMDEATLLRMDIPEETRQALHILHLRKELGYEVPSDAPKGRRWDQRQGKMKESARTARVTQAEHDAAVEFLDQHPRPVMPKRPHDPEHEAAVAEHKAGAPTRREKGSVTEEPTDTTPQIVRDHGGNAVHGKSTVVGTFKTRKEAQAKAPDLADEWHEKTGIPKGKQGDSPSIAIVKNDAGKWEAKMTTPKLAKPKATKRDMTPEELDAEHAAAVKEHGKARPKRPPLTDEEKAALAKYRADKAEWDKKYARKHAAATAKVQAFRKSADDAYRRGDTLDEAALKQTLEDDPDKADLFNQYHDAVMAFAQHHLQSGGRTPTRVAYSKAPTSLKRRRQGGGGRSLVPRAPGRQHASTGKTFMSGNYLIDSRAPIIDALRAQRLQTSITAYHEVINELALDAKTGDPVPKGMVFVRKSGLASLGRVEKQLDDNPMAHADYYKEESRIRKQFTDAIEGATGNSEHAEEAGYFIPKGAWKRVADYARPESQSAYMKFMREYQRALISIFPGTTIGNTAGTIPLAFMGGAGQQALRDAWRSRGAADPTLAPASLFGRGVAGGLASEAHHVATTYMDFMRRQSVKGEDFGRLAAYWSKAGPHIRAEAEKLGISADEYAREFAKGRIDPKKLDEFLDHAEKFLGDTVKPNSPLGRKIGHVLLFQNWVGHMAKLMLYTLPIKHPRRTLMLNILAQYGDQYRKDHGVWPQWMTDYIPMTHWAKYVPGGMQSFTTAINAGQLMPQSTAGGLLSNLFGGDRTIQERFGTIAAPPLGEIAQVALQEAINKFGTDSNHADLWRTIVNQGLGIIPGFRKYYPMQGRKPDDLEIFGKPSYKMYGSNFPGRALSPFLQPGAVPTRGPVGFLERAFGAGTYSVPGPGPITDIQNSKMERFYPSNQRAETTRKRSAARKKAVYDRMRQAGITDPAAALGG